MDDELTMGINVNFNVDPSRFTVDVYKMEIREYDGVPCFVHPGTASRHYLYNDLCIMEFMELDADDVNALLRFQELWGVIRSVNRSAWSDSHQPLASLDGHSFAVGPKERSQSIMSERAGIEKTDRIHDLTALSDMESLLDFVDPYRLTAVSVDEVRACVNNLQIFISVLRDIAMNGVVVDPKDKMLLALDESTWYFGRALAHDFPVIDIADSPDVLPLSKPLIPMLMAQFLFDCHMHLSGEYPFRTCRNCGSWFNQGRRRIFGKEAYLQRTRTTEYCCAECQKVYSNHRFDKPKKTST